MDSFLHQAQIVVRSALIKGGMGPSPEDGNPLFDMSEDEEALESIDVAALDETRDAFLRETCIAGRFASWEQQAAVEAKEDAEDSLFPPVYMGGADLVEARGASLREARIAGRFASWSWEQQAATEANGATEAWEAAEAKEPAEAENDSEWDSLERLAMEEEWAVAQARQQRAKEGEGIDGNP